MAGFFGVMLLLVVILAIAASYQADKGKEHDAQALKLREVKIENAAGDGLMQAQVLTIQPEISRTAFGNHFYWHWVASSRGVPFMCSKEWQDNSHKKTAGEILVSGLLTAPGYQSVSGYTKRDAESRAKSAPFFWELVRTLEEQGWRAVYKQDGAVESMVRAELQIVDGKIVPMDPEFSLAS